MRGQIFGEGVARFQHLLLQLVVDQAEAMARLDIGQGDRHQLRGLRGVHGGAVLADARQEIAELRQIVGVDEAELLEEGMARRQIGEQFDHGLGDLAADLGQGPHQVLAFQDLPHIGVVGDLSGAEGRRPWACRTAGSRRSTCSCCSGCGRTARPGPPAPDRSGGCGIRPALSACVRRDRAGRWDRCVPRRPN